MSKKRAWKEIIITFLITGLVTTLFVAPIAGVLTWYLTKTKHEAQAKEKITELRNQIMEETAKALDNNITPDSDPLENDNSDSNSNNNKSPGDVEWKQYKNDRYDFQISYPSNYDIKYAQNGDGIFISKGMSVIAAYGVMDSSKNVRAYIAKNYPKAKNIKNFTNDEASGLSFDNQRDKYVIFKNGSNYIIITAELPDEQATGLLGDIAFTFVPL